MNELARDANLLAERPWPAIVTEPPPVVVVPLGSCEQHGPHLPLDTDSRIAHALASMLADERPGVLVAPVVAYGASWEHDGFPGLLSLDAAVLSGLIVQLAHSADWARGLVVVNGHGGNTAALRAASEQLQREGRDVLAWSPRVDRGDLHAGRTETSIMLAIAPELVRVDLATAGAPDASEAVLRRDGVRPRIVDVSGNGVLGDPSGASAAEGGRLLAELAIDLLGAFDRWMAPA